MYNIYIYIYIYIWERARGQAQVLEAEPSYITHYAITIANRINLTYHNTR